ncbi:hypothetical protein [Labrenzia sp. R5_0]|uniref:crAss001_48 related protein n=1 Tax=Labrenzia sp. R5_0 TaxID=2821108 RepID=UPI001ADA9E5B|nr:hypothetical protein [Labrenzia sp. R5_0]MBO9458956.1 hypothetical protein [Labrenzia sp. R5_0]
MTAPDRKPHETRVLVERGELADKLEKLSAFIESAEWHGLPETDRDLLIEQRNHMTEYLGVLQRRVARFL